MKALLKRSLLLVTVVLVICASSAAFGQAGSKKNVSPPFPHKIAYNDVDPQRSEKDVGIRHLTVLVKRVNFTRPRLIALYKYLSEKFPQPDILLTTVYDDDRDILKEGEFAQIPDSPYNNSSMKGRSANFTRSKDSKYILIHYKNGDSDEIEMK